MERLSPHHEDSDAAVSPVIGVLALQGDVAEHIRAVENLGVAAKKVRTAAELDAVDALILPGGESTTIEKLARTFEVFEPIQERLRSGMPAFGTCAGMIMLAERIEDGIEGQTSFGGLDITVVRNGFGRQVDSFEADLDVQGLDEPFRAVFIRAPWVLEIGAGVEVLATEPKTGRIVAVRQGPLMATSFHPEVGGDGRLHQMFINHLS